MITTSPQTSAQRLPAPRPHASGADAFAALTGDGLRSAAYQEFMYGYGVVPGVDLGRPLRYSKDGPVFRQDFERGVTLANVGDSPVEIPLDGTHADADGAPRTAVTLPPRSGEVLRRT